MLISHEYGYCHYRIKQPSVIWSLYIYKPYRRQGNSRKILLEAIDKIKKKVKGRNKIFIEADPIEDSISKETLIRYYESLGLTVMNKYED